MSEFMAPQQMRHRRASRHRLPLRWAVASVLPLLLSTSSLVIVSGVVPRPAVAAEPPPGGLVASAPDFGWTPGEFSVGEEGAARYRVRLWLPAGRGRSVPELSLSYSSRNANGYLGVGWSLDGLSSVSWCARTIAQDGYVDGGHFDGADPLCLDGNRLVPMSPPQLPQREFRTERETFARIVGYGMEDNVPTSLQAWTRDGTILTFGQTADARVDAYRLQAGSDLSEPSLVRAATTRVTTAWALNRIEDRNGNAATVEYARAEGDAAGLWWAHLRPSVIRYAPNRSVHFVYEPRPDPIDGFAAGTHTRTDVRLSRIEMRGGPQGGTAELLRQYRLSYQANSITGRSLLTMVSECDHDGTCKLPLTFDYSPGSYQFQHVDAGDAGSDGYVGLVVGDVDGDGRGDLLHQGEQGYVIQRGGGDGFASPVASGLPELVPQGLRPVNVDGDGRLDVVAPVRETIGGVTGYRWRLYQSNGATLVAAPGTLDVWRQGFGNDAADPVYFADLDGNGAPDFVSAILDDEGEPGPWYYRLNTGAAGAGRFAARVETSVTPSSSLFGNNNFVVDADGDGRAELITMAHPTPDITPPLPQPGWVGWGLFPGASGVEGKASNVWGHSVMTHFGDLNGDGLEDAVYAYNAADPGGGAALQAQLGSGNGFGSRRAGTPPAGYVEPDPIAGISPDKGVRIADFNNDGRDDVLVLHEGTPTGPGDTARGAQLYVWKDTGFVRAPLSQAIGSNATTGWFNAQPLDWDGDGAIDLVHNAGGHLTVYRRLGGVPDRLVGVGNTQYRGRTEIEYSTLADRTVHTPGSCGFPQACPTGGGSVVARHKVTTNFGTPGQFSWDVYTHTYMAARKDLHGRGWLGFATHTVTRTLTGATTVTTFDNTFRDPGSRSYPFAHLPKTTIYTVKNVNTKIGREFQHTITNGHVLRRPTAGTYSVVPGTVIETERERPVGGAWQTLRTKTTQASFDAFDNVDVVSAATTNGRTLTVDVDYRNDTAGWLIGLPTRKVSTGCTVAGVCATRTSTLDYDVKGNLTTAVVEPGSPAMRLTTTTAYGQVGVVTSITRTDGAGQSRTEAFEYDVDMLHPIATTNAVGHRTLVQTHSGLGVPLSITDPNGTPTATMRYDWFGRLRETNRADGSFEHISHTYFLRQYTTTTLSGGGSVTVVADQLGRERERRVRAFDGRIATTYTNYDPLGRGVQQLSRPALPGETVQYTTTLYDNRGRATSITAPDGARLRHEYLNQETHSYDAQGVHSFTAATVDGDVESRYEDDPNSTGWLRTGFEYGPFGQTTKMVAPDSTAQTMQYDVLGRRTRLQDPSSGTTITTYNAFGEVATVTDATNRTTTVERDPLGRIKKETSPDGVATNVWDTAANGKGRLTRATSTDGVVTAYTYDTVGRPATQRWTVDGAAYEIGHGYDTAGRPASLTYPAIPGVPDRLRVIYAYNQHGYLSQVSDAADGTAYWTAVERDGAGQLTRERYGNDMLTTRAYQPTTGLLTSLTTIGPGGDTLGRLSYGYDANRNVTGRTDHVNGRIETYGYDELNRLKTWQASTGALQVAADYTYDKVGNLTSETVTGVPNLNATYTYGQNGAPPHALTTRNGASYTYDAAGRQVTGPQRTVQYNGIGLPTLLTWGQNGRTEFEYDAVGDRAVKRDAGQTVTYVPGYAERRNPAGTGGNEVHNIHNIVVDGRVIAQVNRVQTTPSGPIVATRLSYLHTDQQRSTTLITNRTGDPLGEDDSWLRELFYDPFGRRIDARYQPLGNNRHNPRVGYTGHEHDDEFGLINMKGRIYDPMQRRFLTPDPVVQEPLASQSHNRYAYVWNNPTTYTDPTGFQAEPGGSSDDDTSAVTVPGEIIYVTPVNLGPDMLGAMLYEFALMHMQFMLRAELEMQFWISGGRIGALGPRRIDPIRVDNLDPDTIAAAAAGTTGLLSKIGNWFNKSTMHRLLAWYIDVGTLRGEGVNIGYNDAGKTEALTRRQEYQKAAETRPSNRPNRSGSANARATAGGVIFILGLIQGLISDYETYQRAEENGNTFQEQMREDSSDSKYIVPFLLPLPFENPYYGLGPS